jgi:hypothetical protein
MNILLRDIQQPLPCGLQCINSPVVFITTCTVMSIVLPQSTVNLMLPFDTEQILHKFAASSYGNAVCLCVLAEFIYGKKKFHTFRLQFPV